MVLVRSLAAAAAISLLAANIAFAEGKKNAASEDHASLAPEISLSEFKKLVDTKGATVIDANGKTMYQDGHVPGAISFAAVEGNLASTLPADKNATLVAYCGGPMCSAWEAAAKEAKAAGYTNVKHLKAGIKGWKDAGYAMEKGAK